MLVSDFKVNSRLKNILKEIFSGIHGMPLTRMGRKNTLPHNRGSHTILATSTKLLDIKSEVYRSGGDLTEINITKEY